MKKNNQRKQPKDKQEMKLRRIFALQATKMVQDQRASVYFEAKHKVARNLLFSDAAESPFKPENDVDCHEMFQLLLIPLEKVKGGIAHPEGDALYHSLQVFELAKNGGYANDIEFLQAALLHDVGKALDPLHHVEAAIDALDGFVGERVLFLIRHHMDAMALKNGTLGHKKKVQLRQSEFYEDLLNLRDLDDRGRQPGAEVGTLQEAIDYLKSLEKM